MLMKVLLNEIHVSVTIISSEWAISYFGLDYVCSVLVDWFAMLFKILKSIEGYVAK